jgi:hypothetical protein
VIVVIVTMIIVVMMVVMPFVVPLVVPAVVMFHALIRRGGGSVFSERGGKQERGRETERGKKSCHVVPPMGRDLF